MVAKISHGTSLYGALAYNYDKVTAGTAKILSGNRMISDRLGLPSEDIRLALLSFENYLLANRNTEKPVLHISLSPAPEDRLTDGQLVELAERYMQKMGYGNQPYIAYKHADTHNAHIHIVSVCVDGQGKKISDAYEHRRSMTACRELETDFGLRNGADTERRNPKAELKKVDASLGDVRHQVGNTLKAVLESYRFQTFGEYSALLSTLNIEAKQIRGEYNGIPYTGIVYSATDDTGKVVSPPFKSSRFGKRFGNELLEKRMLNISRWCSVRMSGDVSTVSPSLTTTDGRCSTVHAWARSFPPMCSTTISNGWKTCPKRNGADIPLQSFGNITATNPAARSNWRRAYFRWKPTRVTMRRKPLHAA